MRQTITCDFKEEPLLQMHGRYYATRKVTHEILIHPYLQGGMRNAERFQCKRFIFFSRNVF